jgi:pimeloyl-ACP methyl ester carboxylesterase
MIARDLTDVAATVLAYDRIGTGPPLVLLHPLGADRHVWQPIVERLSSRRELIAVDLPGFGESSPLDPDLTPTPKALAAAVAGLLHSLGVARPQVAGNSLGGWVALELALAGEAQSVTAIAPAGLWPRPLTPKPGVAHNLANRFLPLVGIATSNRLGRRVLLASTIAHPSRITAEGAAQLVRAYALAPGFNAVNDAMRAGAFGGLERIRVPVTLIWPERDRLIARPPWLPDNVRSVVLKDAGHIPMWDAPDKLAELLLGIPETQSNPRRVHSLRANR